jgi:hypothetical protein
MKVKKVKTSTQYECNTGGKNCKILYQYVYDTKGRLIKRIEFSKSKPFMTFFYSYNKFDKADTVYIQFSGQNKYISQVYKFNNDGNLIEYHNCYEKKGCELNEKYEYTNNGLLKKKIEYRNEEIDTETDYSYDNSGNNIETIAMFVSSNLPMQQNYFYNHKGELIRSVNYAPDGTELDSTTYEYDNNGKLTHLSWMGGLNTHSTYKYDSEGNEIEYISTAFGGQINDHRIMSYLNGLPITRFHYEKGKIKLYFKFTYELYD